MVLFAPVRRSTLVDQIQWTSKVTEADGVADLKMVMNILLWHPAEIDWEPDTSRSSPLVQITPGC